jgi:hypothetical protein
MPIFMPLAVAAAASRSESLWLMTLGAEASSTRAFTRSRLAFSDSIPQEIDEALDVALAGSGGGRLAADARSERPSVQRSKDRRGQRLNVAFREPPLALSAPQPRR